MKRIIYILILLLIGFTATAQETPPAGLKAINAQFYIHLPDSTIWQQKGSPYNWHQVPKQKAIKHYIDSIAGLGGLYKLKTDSVNNSGYVTHGYFNSHSGTRINIRMDSLYARTVNLFNSQTIYGSKLFKSPTTITDTTNGSALTLNGNGTALTVNGFAQFNSNIGFVGNLTWDAVTSFKGLQFFKAGDPINYYQLVFDPATLKFGSAYDNANFKPFATEHHADSVAKAKADSVFAAHPGTGGTVTSITPGYGHTSSAPITTFGTLTIDTTKLLTILNTFPKNDTRYYTKTAVDNLIANGSGLPLDTNIYTRTGVLVGNSIANGAGATNKVYSFATQVAAKNGVRMANYSVSGTTLVLHFAGDSSAIDRLTRITPTYTASSGYQFYLSEYGTNDGYNINGTLDTAAFRAAYYTLINQLTTNGWPANRIIIFLPYNHNPNGVVLNNMIANIAIVKGVRYIDMWNQMIAAGGDALLIADLIHPNNTGHAVMGGILNTYLLSSPYNLVQTPISNFNQDIITPGRGYFGVGVYGGTTKNGFEIHGLDNTNGSGKITAFDKFNALQGINFKNNIISMNASGGVTTPNYLSFGGQFSTGVIDGSNMQIILYDAGTPTGKTGLGVSSADGLSLKSNAGTTARITSIDPHFFKSNITIGSTITGTTTAPNWIGTPNGQFVSTIGSATTTVFRGYAGSGMGFSSNNGVFLIAGSGLQQQISLMNNTTITGILNLNASITAASATARVAYLNPTLVAAANNDFQVALDINPTFTNGAFTGLTNAGIRTSAAIIPSFAAGTNIGAPTLPFGNVYTRNVQSDQGLLLTAATSNNISFKAGSAVLGTLFSGGNWLIQTGGTPTNNGFLFDIQGTLRATGHTTFEGITSTGAIGTGNIVYSISPTLTGSPLAPTQSAGDNSTKIATTAYADRVGAIAGSFSGVGTATTTFTVTIGATQANNTYKVNVTPTDLLGAAVFYVNNKTTTTFDVVYITGLTGTLTFDWALFK